MSQPRFDSVAAPQAGLIEAWIIAGLAQCKPISEIAAEIEAQLQVGPNPASPDRTNAR